MFYKSFPLDMQHDLLQKKIALTFDPWVYKRAEYLLALCSLLSTCTFGRNARFDVILTSVTIINHVFPWKLFCFESLVDIEVSKL